MENLMFLNVQLWHYVWYMQCMQPQGKVLVLTVYCNLTKKPVSEFQEDKYY